MMCFWFIAAFGYSAAPHGWLIQPLSLVGDADDEAEMNLE
jgi:hypothetical protein